MPRFNPDAYGNPRPRKKPVTVAVVAPKPVLVHKSNPRQVVAAYKKQKRDNLPTILEDASYMQILDEKVSQSSSDARLNQSGQQSKTVEQPIHEEQVHEDSRQAVAEHSNMPVERPLAWYEQLERLQIEELRAIRLRIKGRDEKATTSLLDLELARRKPKNKTPLDTAKSAFVSEVNHRLPQNNHQDLPIHLKGNCLVPFASSNPFNNPEPAEDIHQDQTLAPFTNADNADKSAQRYKAPDASFDKESSSQHPLMSWDNTMLPPDDWDERPDFDYNSPGFRDSLDQWRHDASGPSKQITDELFRTIPHEKLQDLDAQPDGISLVPRGTTLTVDNAEHYGYSTNETEEIAQHTQPTDESEYEDWGKVDLSQPQNRIFKEETTEALVSNWNEVTREQRARVDAETRRQMDELVAMEMGTYEPSEPVEIEVVKGSKVNIYLRPASKSDVPQITGIYNWYIKNSPRCAEYHAIDDDEMEVRMEDIWSSKLPFIVALERNKDSFIPDDVYGEYERLRTSPHPIKNYDPRFKQVTGKEKIVGFACAQDLTASDYVERISAELEVYVDPAYRQLGIGKCLLDQLMDSVNIAHLKRATYPFSCPQEFRHKYSSGGDRQFHKVYFLIRKWTFPKEPGYPREYEMDKVSYKYRDAHPTSKPDDMDDDFDKWMKNYLEIWGFQVEAVLKKVAAKKGRFIDEVFVSRETAWNPQDENIPDPPYRF